MRHFILLLAAVVLVAVPATATAKDKTKWLCKPSLKSNPCRGGLAATVLHNDGSSSVEKSRNAKNPKVDCFYVYPTVSDQKTTNATLHIDPEERAVATFQASRFSQTCDVWAPMYKQVTLVGISNANAIPAAAQAKAYKSVLSAWREYLAKHNHGRGVVLIGHSQGSFVLRRLIADEIDKRPAVRRRIVSAIIPGGNVLVKKGRDAGGDFKNVRACRSAKQIGCVIGYSAYGEDPPEDSLFGRVPAGAGKGLQVLCTNPAALAGGRGTLKAYASTVPFPGTLGLGVRIFLGDLPDVPTPWLRPPGVYTAQCASAGGASFLRVAAHDGARVPPPVPDATWGYHLGDVNLPMGNLTALVKRQTAAYLRSVRSR
jgi:hypothetical protein